MTEPTHPTTHESRLTQGLRELLHTQRVASLGTLDTDGCPFVSMVPYALDTLGGTLVIHISDLAAHTGNLRMHPRCSALVMQTPDENRPVHALPRITLSLQAKILQPDDVHIEACRAVYLAKFPESAPITALPDFHWVQLTVLEGRQVAGFGAARTVDPDELQRVLRHASPTGTLH